MTVITTDSQRPTNKSHWSAWVCRNKSLTKSQIHSQHAWVQSASSNQYFSQTTCTKQTTLSLKQHGNCNNNCFPCEMKESPHYSSVPTRHLLQDTGASFTHTQVTLIWQTLRVITVPGW